MPTFGSLFAGVGGLDLGMETAGWRCAWQVEWDDNCQQVLAHHWPDVPRWSDVRDVHGADVPPVDCITFGSPCQDLSNAGKRAGLAGDRSGLFTEATRIIQEMRRATDDEFPRWAIWENVTGALSSNGGRDFRAVIGHLASAGSVVIEWALLDARHWVPQRRRRVFVVAGFGARAATCPDPLLPVGPRCPGHSGQGIPARENHPADAAPGTGSDRRHHHLAFSENQRGEVVLSDYAHAMVATGGGKPGSGYPAVLTFAMQPDDGGGIAPGALRLVPTDVAPTIAATDGAKTTDRGLRIATSTTVRRLTPLECERLNGWPDDHTRWRADGTEQADVHRYRQVGNGVAAPVAAWVATHLLAAHLGMPSDGATVADAVPETNNGPGDCQAVTEAVPSTVPQPGRKANP